MMKKCKHIRTYTVFFLVLCGYLLPGNTALAKDPSFYAQQSKLATGKWVKLQVSDNAIYKLTYEEIQAMGLDPAKASIHGYGGWILNESFSVNDYADDLPEVPVWISGNDNKLDPGEFLLFYGKGPVKWSYNTSAKEFQHENNPYSLYGYYFITDATGATSIVNKATEETAGNTLVTTFDDYAVHEQDLHTIIASGRQLYGENFKSATSQNFRFTIDGMVNEKAKARIRFISAATIINTSVKASIGSASTSHLFPSAVTSEGAMGYTGDSTWEWTPGGSNTVDVNVTYSHSGYNAYLDYLRLNMKRELKAYGNYTFFRNKFTQNGNYRYEASNASSGMFVLEVTPGKAIEQKSTSFNNGKLVLHARETSSTVREYVLIDPSKPFPKPEIVGEIGNQNLHGLPEGIDMIIITRPVYWDAALALAKKHKEISNLQVEVIDADLIYNEFSSGTPDATAYRRFMKMLYDRGISKQTEPRYLLLIGKSSYDNRLITEAWKNYKTSNLLLSYQSENSLSHSDASYISDDYFGHLSDNSSLSSKTLQLGIGRLPVNTAQEAQTVVNKIINYMENQNAGDWKNRMIFIGGDETKRREDGSYVSSTQYEHIKPSNEIAESIISRRPEMFAGKIFYNSFKKDTGNGATSFPGAVMKLDNKLKEGAILLNFLGHGDPSKIDKNIINISSINQMRFKTTPLWILGTCEFSRFDDLTPSAGELALMNATSGAIATISAARIVYINRNIELNKALVKHLFSKDTDGKWLRIGDVLRRAKNDVESQTKLSYHLLGDPALSLNLPEYTVRLETVNGVDASSPGIQFRSEEKLTLKGSILHPNGDINTDFNGKIQTTLMDCANQLLTYDYRKDGSDTYSYQEYLNLLYKGNAMVINGQFVVTIPIPLDISFKNEPGKLSFYAVSSDKQSEASGYFTNFTVGGSVDRDENMEISAPEIRKIYLNSTHFVGGDAVNESPYFVAEVFDTIGINRSGVGIDHSIKLIIDNKPLYTYTLNDYYEDSETTPGQGFVRFMIPDSLAPGRHTLTFRIWNILNKSATQTVDFFVEPGKAPVIFDLAVSANPAKTDVYFTLLHDRPETKVNARLEVFDLTGCPVWSHEETAYTDELASTPIYWDLTSNGKRVKPGVYVYRATVASKLGKESTAMKKLIILAQ